MHKIMKKKKLLFVAVAGVAVLGLVMFLMKRKNGSTLTMAETVVVPPYAIQVTGDPTKAVYLVVDGLKSAFVNEKAFTNYGYMTPKMVSQAEADAIPTKGFVEESGKLNRA